LPGERLIYLTRICSVEYTKSMESVFEILPSRTAADLSLLVSSQQSLERIERSASYDAADRVQSTCACCASGFVSPQWMAQRRLYD